MDIGGELLPILSKGLYTNPLNCIREYVQNGVDAGASEIKIKVTGSSVIIFDNGTGMDKEELLQARQSGVSRKSLEEHVGFRGISIYSGFDLSNLLLITTKKEGEDKAYIMRFDFGRMEQELERIRQGRGDNNIPLPKLLYSYTDFGQEG
ncbi:MAG: ATP-binding protein [Ignavibacteriales bacterium]